MYNSRIVQGWQKVSKVLTNAERMANLNPVTVSGSHSNTCRFKPYLLGIGVGVGVGVVSLCAGPGPDVGNTRLSGLSRSGERELLE